MMSLMHALAADVGGTNARLAWVEVDRRGGSAPMVLSAQTYRCAEYPGLADIVRRFLTEHRGRPEALALACAGLRHGREIVNGNLPWRVHLDALEAVAGEVPLVLSNDFEALARATRWLSPEAGTLLHLGTPSTTAPVVVIGPGTGLGAALRIRLGDREHVLPTEAGRPGFAPVTPEESALLEWMRPLLGTDGHVDTEALLSGPGLLRIYRGLAHLRGLAAVAETPEGVSRSSDSGDPLARSAVELFWGALASTCGNLVLALGAYGGVLLAGGILPRLMHGFDADAFSARFASKGVMRPVLEQVPIHLIEHGQLGIVGAAMALCEG